MWKIGIALILIGFILVVIPCFQIAWNLLKIVLDDVNFWFFLGLIPMFVGWYLFMKDDI